MTAVDRPDNGHDELVWVQLPADDVAFLRGFDPDRDRTATRADMVRVIEHLQDALASGRAGAGEQQREQDIETLRPVLLAHHPIMRSETGPFSGCRCGQVRLGEDVIAHVAGELLSVLGAARPDDGLRQRIEKVIAEEPDILPNWEFERGALGGIEMAKAAMRRALDGDQPDGGAQQ